MTRAEAYRIAARIQAGTVNDEDLLATIDLVADALTKGRDRMFTPTPPHPLSALFPKPDLN